MAASLVKIACVVVVCMSLAGAPVVQGISCEQVKSDLEPCVSYLKKGGAPTKECCKAVESVVAAAQTTADERDVCNCLKDAADSITSSMAHNAESLPGECGVSIPYKISTSTDCDKIGSGRDVGATSFVGIIAASLALIS